MSSVSPALQPPVCSLSGSSEIPAIPSGLHTQPCSRSWARMSDMGVKVQFQWLHCELRSWVPILNCEPLSILARSPSFHLPPLLPIYALLWGSGLVSPRWHAPVHQGALFIGSWLPESWGLSDSGQSVTWDTSCAVSPRLLEVSAVPACLPWSHTSESCFLLSWGAPCPSHKMALWIPRVPMDRWAVVVNCWDPQMQWFCLKGCTFSDHLCASVADT